MLSSKTTCTVLSELFHARQLFARTPTPRVQVPQHLSSVISSRTKYLIIFTASSAIFPLHSSLIRNCTTNMVFKFLTRALFHRSVSRDIENSNVTSKQRPRGTYISSRNSSPTIFNKLPAELLLAVLEQLPPHAVANLALINRWMLCTINEITHPFTELRLPGNRFERAKFLITFDEHHPDELICYACAMYHPR